MNIAHPAVKITQRCQLKCPGIGNSLRSGLETQKAVNMDVILTRRNSVRFKPCKQFRQILYILHALLFLIIPRPFDIITFISCL